MNIQEFKKLSVRIGIVIGLIVVACMAEAHAASFIQEEFTYNQKIAVDVKNLEKIAEEVSEFFKTVHTSKYVKVTEGSAFKGIITFDQVQETIDFIVQQAKKNPNQLKSHWFYKHHFDFYRWRTDGCLQKIGPIPHGWQKPPEAIRITHYRIGKIHGSHKKTEKYSFPLYEMPSDEKGKIPSYITQHKDEFVRFSHSRLAILDGALEGEEKTKVLAWVEPDAYKELAMQGSAYITFGLFSELLHIKVAGNNGQEGEDLYWYSILFKEKKSSKKYPIKVEPVAGVSFAGDIESLGFGKVILFVGKNRKKDEKEMRVGVLVDTGSAFKNNLCQLDLFVGHFEDPHLFKNHCKEYPHTAQAYVLIKKKKKSVS